MKKAEIGGIIEIMIISVFAYHTCMDCGKIFSIGRAKNSNKFTEHIRS